MSTPALTQAQENLLIVLYHAGPQTAEELTTILWPETQTNHRAWYHVGRLRKRELVGLNRFDRTYYITLQGLTELEEHLRDGRR